MHGLQTKLAVTVSSSHALWSWCMRHAAWILNRYNLHQGLTAYEVVYGKPYSGQICEYGEPVLGFAKSLMKGNPRWHRMLFLGKVDGQDSFLLFNGTALILTRSVRRVKTNWVSHMAFYMEFNLYSWQYKDEFGGRVQPTKPRVTPRAVSFAPPVGVIQPSSLVDEDAEAVKQKAREEKPEVHELQRRAGFDKPEEIKRDVEFGDGCVFQEETVDVLDDAVVCQPVVEVSSAAAAILQVCRGNR